MTFDQQAFDVRCEWGEHGVSLLAPVSDVVIIVDVLSFSTSVDIAVGRGAVVFPYRGRGDAALAYDRSVGAELAGRRHSGTRYSLAPSSLLKITPGVRIVLPSPNGSTLSLAAGSTSVLAGCLRNARAVAMVARAYGPKIAIVPAGERWSGDHSLRPALEDLIGAGALIDHLPGRRSPEAMAAWAAYREAEPDLDGRLRDCSSGRELIGQGFEADLALAAQLNVSDAVPVLIDGAYVASAGTDRVAGA